MKRMLRFGSSALLALALGATVFTVGASALAQGHDDHQATPSPTPAAPRLRGLGGAGQGGAQGSGAQGHDGTRQGHGRPSTDGVHGSDKAPSGGGDHGGGDHGTAEHGEGHGEHGGHHELKPMNWTDFSNKETPPFVALLVNLGVLVGLYYWMGKKPVQEGLKARRQSVAKEIEEAARMLKEAEERAKVYQKKLANVDAEKDAAQKALETAGKGERDRIVREAEEKAARMQRDAEFLVQQEIKQMRLDLTNEAVEIAMDAAEKLLREKVTQADHERMADEFLAELSRVPAQSHQGGAS